MSVSHGSVTDFIGNGYLLSPFLTSATTTANRDTAEGTTFQKKSKVYAPGLKDGSMSLEGIWEGELNLVDDILSAALGSGDGVFTYLPQGLGTIGNLAYSLQAFETSWNVDSSVGDLNQCSADLTSGAGGVGVERGLVAHLLQAEAAAGTGPTLDNGATAGATANGASLIVHTTVNAAPMNAYLQDSADGTTWADLAGTIAVPVGRSSLRLSVSGTIRRYTRVRWTGAATFTAVINRK